MAIAEDFLVGQPLPGIDGVGFRLQMQTKALKYGIDDVLLTAIDPNGDERRLSISCKSNKQVSTSGLPSDFLELAWRQWTSSEGAKFERGRDAMALVTRLYHPAFDALWSDVKSWARGTDPVLALSQIRETAKHRKIFDRMKASAKAAKVSPTDREVLELIRSLSVEPLDFDTATSRSERTAIAEARTCLADNTLANGKALWATLVSEARKARIGSGTLDVADLRKSLRAQFRLRDDPNFETSWARLRAISHDRLSEVKTTLPSGTSVERTSERAELLKAWREGPVCVVYGESGTGKSALVKSLLDAEFPKAAQVWLGPEQAQSALSETQRTALGISHPLIDVLDASVSAENVLVLDACERLDEASKTRAQKLVSDLLARNEASHPVAWRVVVVGQTLAWSRGDLQKLAGATRFASHEVDVLDADEVRSVLYATDGLGWLASHDDAVAALRNLQTLAWVLEAAPRFQESGSMPSISLVGIANRLWSNWTGDKAAMQRLLMRLGARDAAFEHSFAISELEDPTTFDNRPASCPLRIDPARNRIRFEHDLASDLARFQQLKEDASNTAKWAEYAANPLWTNALRMLGQHLLRQSGAALSAWDEAFEAAEASDGPAKLAADVLLDALFLDPEASRFLEERAEMLFAGGAKRLLRMLRRFEHVATVSDFGGAPRTGAYADFGLYLEAEFRTPIYSRWPAVATFLTRHRERVVKLLQPIVAELCERWLTGTPAMLSSDSPTPLRKEFAELALAMARELQLDLAKGTAYLGNGHDRFYRAAFAAATDLPQEVGEWALEMAERRPYRPDIVAAVSEHNRERAEEHRKKLQSDPDYRARHERKRQIPTFIPGSKPLPPWPLGARDRIDNVFQETVLRSPRFQVLTRISPLVAAEVLLAAIVDDAPEERYGSRRFDDGLGLAYDQQSYPIGYWKSPFYSFLHINAVVALEALNKLVEFATDRWDHEVDAPPPSLELTLSDGSRRSYRGNSWVFNWSQEGSTHTGQLRSALAALERWLCDLIKRDVDVTRHLEGLLGATTSVSVLAVLVNVGKFKPELFNGPLRPLLTSYRLYVWDAARIDAGSFGFDGMSWAREGEIVFNLAKEWALAPHRKIKMNQVAVELIRTDKALGAFVRLATSRWPLPNRDKEALECRILVASLDDRNYTTIKDEATGEEKIEFAYPADVLSDAQKFQEDKSRANAILRFPDQCRRFLLGSRELTSDEAKSVAELMAAADGDEKVELDEEMQRPARVAAAAALLLRAKQWLPANPEVRARAAKIVAATLDEIDDDDHSRFRYGLAPSYLEFTAFFAAENWIAAPSPGADAAVLKILVSGDDRAVSVLASLTFHNRDALGGRFWRLQQLAIFRAGLSILAPRPGDDEDVLKPHWRRWRAWLTTRSLTTPPVDSSKIAPLAVAERIERFELKRWRARYARDRRPFDHASGRRLSGGLDTHLLGLVFAWLFDKNAGRAASPTEAEERRALVRRFWEYEAWRLSGSAESDDGDYKHMDQFGYGIVAELARLTLEAPEATAAELWRPVFALGPRGHCAIQPFLDYLIGELNDRVDAREFGKRWRPMVEYMLTDPEWSSGRNWYNGQRLERHVLGFANPDALGALREGAALIDDMRQLYRDWASHRLARNEDNLAAFCNFLTFEIGSVLLFDGLQWIATAIRSDPDVGRWRRESTTSGYMSLLDAVASKHLTEIAEDQSVRQAFLELVAHAVSRQLPRALPLQERVLRRLRSV